MPKINTSGLVSGFAQIDVVRIQIGHATLSLEPRNFPILHLSAARSIWAYCEL
jgi:hypothetical protein